MNRKTPIILLLAFSAHLGAQTQTPDQVLARMEKCRQQVINQLSFGDKMKMKAAMGAIQSNPQFISASNAVINATTPETQVQARKALATLKLNLLEKRDPSLKPIIEKIRMAQASVLR
jgi:uncharacterized protein (DUF885 family)